MGVILQPSVLGLGGALVDLLYHVPLEFLSRIPGEKGGTVHVGPEEMEGLLGMLPPQGGSIVRGGATANTLAALAHLGTPAALIGKTGDDEAGRWYREQLRREGVDVSLLKISCTLPTGRVLSLITPDADRTMRSCLAASAELRVDDLLESDFAGKRLLYVEGYALCDEAVVLRACELARAQGMEVHFDLSSPEVVRAHRKFLLEVLPRYVKTIYANLQEAHALCGMQDAPEETLHALAQFCAEPILKLGERGVLLLEGRAVVSVPGCSVKAVDGTGAGDFWAAGYLHGMLEGWSRERAAWLGNLVASEVVQVTGAVLPEERWQFIHEHMRIQK